MLSSYQIAFVIVLAVVVVVFMFGFRSYDKSVRMHRRADWTSHEMRRQSSLATNTDIDSEEALKCPLAVNRDILHISVKKGPTFK